MHLILHVGQHKTGTTSIQYVLRGQRELFQAHGILVPSTGQAKAGNHRPLVAGLVECGDASLARSLRNEFAAFDGSCALISAELMTTLLVRNRGEALLRRLREAGATRFTIVMYVRSPYQWANAAYSQNTSSFQGKGLRMRDFTARQLAGSTFDYFRIVDLAQREDIELILRPYNASVARSVVADLVGVLGLPRTAVEAEPRLNASIGPIAVEAMRVVCSEQPDLVQSKRVRLKTLAMEICAAFPEPAPFWGIDDDFAPTLDYADAQTERLAQFAWSRSWRDVIGDERRRPNTFDPVAAEPAQRAVFDAMLGRMREAASGLPT